MKLQPGLICIVSSVFALSMPQLSFAISGESSGGGFLARNSGPLFKKTLDYAANAIDSCKANSVFDRLLKPVAPDELSRLIRTAVPSYTKSVNRPGPDGKPQPLDFNYGVDPTTGTYFIEALAPYFLSYSQVSNFLPFASDLPGGLGKTMTIGILRGEQGFIDNQRLNRDPDSAWPLVHAWYGPTRKSITDKEVCVEMTVQTKLVHEALHSFGYDESEALVAADSIIRACNPGVAPVSQDISCDEQYPYNRP